MLSPPCNTEEGSATTSLLPLIRDEAHSIATIKHVLEKIRETVQFLNPGQTPVVAAERRFIPLLNKFSRSGQSTERTRLL